MIRLPLIIGALPVTLLNGTTADATQVMADLNWIVNQVNANAASTVNQAVTNANNNFTTVQSGQAATQPANFVIASQIENNSLQTLSSVLGTNTVTARISALPLGAYVSGQVFTFVPANPNTGATTLNIDGVGQRSILNMGSALSGAELQNYKSAFVFFNGGTNAFDLLNGTPYVKGPNIPATGTLNLDGTPGDYSQVDGIATITAMTLSPGRQKLLEFTSSPLLTRSGSLILPLASNIVPTPGDTALIRGEPGGVRVVGYQRANGAALFPFSQYFESAPQTITSAGALTISHGMSVIPRLVMCVLTNVSPDSGYTAGQQLFQCPSFLTGTAGAGIGVAVVPDATNLNIRFGSQAQVFSALNFTTGAGAALTNASWTITFRVWA